MTISFKNTYADLPKNFYTNQLPEPVTKPSPILINEELAEFLSIPIDWINSEQGIGMLSGNATPEGSNPIASVYAGHQFGSWNPQLGDGRAILLGEVKGKDGLSYDVQLKGAGPTPYSRAGDGRSPLGPVLREHLISEAMNALGITSTRALASVETGEYVMRETSLPGAILTRVARSHVRIGTFQYFASIKDIQALELLTNYVFERHYSSHPVRESKALALLEAVMESQAELIAKWQSVGFVHGVMNTDNMLVSGETIDFGPCAFIDNFKKDAVFSSIDHMGRYSYENQPNIVHWNIACFAQALLPIIEQNETKALELAKEVIERFPKLYKEKEEAQMRPKFGFKKKLQGDQHLMEEFFLLLEENQLDFTLSFRRLSEMAGETPKFSVSEFTGFPTLFDEWLNKWKARTGKEGNQEIQTEMISNNPAIIPRNHIVEQAINEATDGNFNLFRKLVTETANPFDLNAVNIDLAKKPRPDQTVRQTFCGT
tara:strand:- start:1208 stop:2668 length:1461 start_codon:yes stop_codon:yes gene_type:complete